MAVLRQTINCLYCDKVLREKHLDQSHLPMEMRLIGDTFLGYEPCDCKGYTVQSHVSGKGEKLNINK
jgi:hypothetical protein